MSQENVEIVRVIYEDINRRNWGGGPGRAG
jgi:hypothetical protein